MSTSNEIRAAAVDYLRRGWAPIPVGFDSKAPTVAGWNELVVTNQTAEEYFSGNVNVGVRLGQPSGGLIDIDLDSPEAVFLAGRFLPATDAVFGRPSKVASHWLYVVDPPVPSERFKDPDGTMLLEPRSTGCQTVFPPSSHGGEAVLWIKNGNPSKQQGPWLLTRVRRLAAASLLARHWPVAGSRQEAALALAGGLLKLEWDTKEVADFIAAVAQAAGDEEWKMRFNTAEYTERRLERDLPATAWKRLETLLDPAAVRQARAWLEADKRTVQEQSPGADHRELDAEIKTQAQQLLKLADPAALFHTPDDEGFATVPINGHKENLLIRSSGFRDWLLFVFYKTFGKPPSTEAFKNAIGVLDARARYEGPTAPVFLRIAHLGQDIYIDLCNSDWEVVRVTTINSLLKNLFSCATLSRKTRLK